MPICKKCTSKFPSTVVIEGRERNLGSRRYCFACSPFGQHNTRVLHQERYCTGRQGELTECRNCGRRYLYERKKGHKVTECNSCQSNRHGKNTKIRAIEYKGGKCQRCGYSKCSRALGFHHRDPQQKEFSIGSRGNKSWETIRAELDKCDLLCANCHAEVHDEIENPGEAHADERSPDKAEAQSSNL